MRYVVYGAGAVGATVGGWLFEAGHDVTLIARGEHGRAMANGGLRLSDPDRARTLRVPVADHPAGLSWAGDELVVLAMKTQDSPAAVSELAAAAPPSITVACAQNGVENERLALRRFGSVCGICVILPATYLEPGVVEVNSAPTPGILDVGRYPAGVDATAARIAADLAGAGFESRPDDHIMRWKYAKLIGNLGNAVDALCGPSARDGELQRRARSEGVACLKAAGIEFASAEEDAGRRQGHLRLRPVEGRRRQGSSSWQSLARGTGTVEADYLNGEIVLLGRLYGVPTPVNALLQSKANEIARRGDPPGSVAVEALLAELG